MIVDIPSGVAPVVVSVTVVVHVGRQDGAEKLAVVPVGNPLAEKVTDAAAPDEAVDHFLLRHRPAELREHLHVDTNRQALAVHEHPVTVEDEELDAHTTAARARSSTVTPGPPSRG